MIPSLSLRYRGYEMNKARHYLLELQQTAELEHASDLLSEFEDHNDSPYGFQESTASTTITAIAKADLKSSL
jgi:hypothetical protein